MEALYKKLYDKYTKLKTKKLSEMDQLNEDQEVKFVNYISAAEELIQYLKNENERLQIQVTELISEVASVRSGADGKLAEYQKLLIDENQKNKDLSEEVEKLRKVAQERDFGGYDEGKIDSDRLQSPRDAKILAGEVSNSSAGRNTRKHSREVSTSSAGRNTRKRSRDTASESVALSKNVQEDATIRQSENQLSKKNISIDTVLGVQQPECFGRHIDLSGGGIIDSGSNICLYQSLLECLMGMELSTSCQTEGMCISALHKPSGYSFSLTWVNKAVDEVDILYRVLSLGTFERVAPEWMKDVIIFSTSMCPIFFERVTQVIKLH